MALTDFSDVFVSIHETAFNNIVLQLQRQRPSLFNYGTAAFKNNPALLCNDIMQFIDQDVISFENPVIHPEKLLPIPGYSGPFGLEYCLQLSKLSIDFFPNNVQELPPQLGMLPEQSYSLQAQVCVGLGCTSIGTLAELVSQEEANDKLRLLEVKQEPKGLPFRKPICFCLDLFAVLRFERKGTDMNPIIALKLRRLEIVDIKPDGLENMAECFLKTFLMLSVLPKIKLALNDLVLGIANVLTIQPTPVSETVPFNPAIEDDQVKIFINLSN